MNAILFLTACVNPSGMAFTKLNNPEVRVRQYKEALDWYLENTEFHILLVENSNYDFSKDYQGFIDEGRLEYLTFDGNNFDRSKGKGYGEAAILDYGLKHSQFLGKMQSSQLVIKVTGRLLCTNINYLLKDYHTEGTLYANIAKDDWGGQHLDKPICYSSCFFLERLFLA